MTAGRVLVATTIAAASFAVSAVASTTAAHPTLFGTVGKNNAYTIMLASSTGKRVTKLKQGTYTHRDPRRLVDPQLRARRAAREVLEVHDRGFKGTKTFTLKLAAGKYKAYCAPHESMMFQHFTLT